MFLIFLSNLPEALTTGVSLNLMKTNITYEVITTPIEATTIAAIAIMLS